MADAPSTVDLIQIKEFRDGVVILKDDSVRGVVEVSAINFELRSSEEQTAIIQQFQGFLNSIDFPIQIVVQSRKFDITEYLATVQTAAEQLTNELLKMQAQEYMRFVRELSDLANIMSKRFYVTIPLAVSAKEQSSGGFFSNLFKKKKAPAVTPEAAQETANYKLQLQQRADLIISGLSGMGMKGHMLEQGELVTLFTQLYNPVVPAKQTA